jgi:hypothetical protein
LNALAVNIPRAGMDTGRGNNSSWVDEAPAWNELRWRMMAATVFLVLLARYFLGDSVLQSDWQATNKTRSWAALAHVASYHSS